LTIHFAFSITRTLIDGQEVIDNLASSIRIVEVLGRDLPMKLFKETQRIEKDGGMMIMNGQRRRTPGGVFLFLLKHSEEVPQDQKKLIFIDDTRKKNLEKKGVTIYETRS